MKIFQKPANTTIGVDIGSFSTKAVQLGNTQHGTSLDAYTKINSSDIDLESFKYLQELTKSIFKNAIYGSFDSKNIILSLPRKMVFETIVTINKNKLKSPKKDIEYQLRTMYNLNVDYLYVNFVLLSESQIESSKITQSYAVVCITKDLANLVIGVFKDYGFKKVVITSDLAAISLSLVKKNQTTAIVDIGHNTSSYIFSDGKRFVSSKLNFSSDKLNKIISESLKLSSANTGKLLYSVGIENSQQGNEVKSVCKDYFLEFVNDLNENIKKTNFFSEDQNNVVEKIRVSGHITNIPGLIDYVEKKTGLTIESANPWLKISTYPLKPMPKSSNPLYVNAIGLALASKA